MAPKMAWLKQLCAEAGFTPSKGGSWDDGIHTMYVSSIESYGPESFGHPLWEASYSYETGWIAINSPNLNRSWSWHIPSSWTVSRQGAIQTA